MPSSLRGTFLDDSDGRLVHEALDRASARLLPARQPRAAARTRAWRRLSRASTTRTRTTSRPADYRSFLNQSNPHLSGIGIDVLPDPRGSARRRRLLRARPRRKPGLAQRRSDRAGRSNLARKPLGDFASSLIKGPAGTQVTLTVVSGGQSRRRDDHPREHRRPGGHRRRWSRTSGVKIGDVQLTSFTDGSGTELRTQVDKLLHCGRESADPRSARATAEGC